MNRIKERPSGLADGQSILRRSQVSESLKSVYTQRQIESILSRLENVRRTPRGWVALCPAHADKFASLSIRDTGDRVLFHCFAGCTYREICDALDIGLLQLDHNLTATKRGSEIAKLSRR